MDCECGEDEKCQAAEDRAVSVNICPPNPIEPESFRQLDLNSEPCIARKLACDDNDITMDEENPHEEVSSTMHKSKAPSKAINPRGVNLNLNSAGSSCSANVNPSHSCRNLDHLRSGEVSECASSSSPQAGKDPMRVWKEMKQNGFLSSSYGGIPMPKKRGRKKKNDLLKERLELAKKEQADQFAKLAAPSGLLNGLNPGIINHVRNRKQVHSIIEALAKSERAKAVKGGSKEINHVKTVNQEIWNRKDLGFYDMSINKSLRSTSEDEGSAKVRKLYNQTFGSFSDKVKHDDISRQNLSSSIPKTSDMSKFEDSSANLTNVTSLSVKAATIASRWLELMHQDIKGRLTALRCSKERLHAVINTELPFLISKEFSTNQGNDPIAMKSTAGRASSKYTDMHRLTWSKRFDQMGKTLSEEEQLLETWLNQVKEMQLHCEYGLQHFQCTAARGLANPRTRDDVLRSGSGEDDDSCERELALRAAAASIYSTCNYLLSKGDVLCC